MSRSRIENVCLILDQELLRTSPVEALTAAAAAGIAFFQYRNKPGSRREIYEASRELAVRARDMGALFIVNDHADIAAAVGADGVHLGQEDLPIGEARKLLGKGRIVGISTHNREQAVAAERAGADYIGFGPVFATSTKDAGNMQGTARITGTRQAVSIPVVAIGGINSGNIKQVVRSGASGVAVISAVLSAPDLREAAAELATLFESHRSMYQGGDI